jgi:hypothetical protein
MINRLKELFLENRVLILILLAAFLLGTLVSGLTK